MSGPPLKAPPLDVLAGLYAAVKAMPEVMGALGPWGDDKSLHTRRPVPDEAGYPQIIIGPQVSRTDSDGIRDWRPLVAIDLAVYGEQPKHYRLVDDLAEFLYGAFHRQRTSASFENYDTTNIQCSGPIPAPDDDDEHVGRVVTLNMELCAIYIAEALVAYDFTLLSHNLVQNLDWLSRLNSMITALGADVGGDSVAGVMGEIVTLAYGMSTTATVVNTINQCFTPNDSTLQAVFDDIIAERTALGDVYTNLEADVAGSSVAQAITDLTAISDTLSSW